MENQNEIKAANIIASWWKKIYDYRTQLWGESMLDNYCFEDNYEGMGNTDDLDYVISKEERLMSQKYSDQHGTDYRFDDEDRFTRRQHFPRFAIIIGVNSVLAYFSNSMKDGNPIIGICIFVIAIVLTAYYFDIAKKYQLQERAYQQF